MADPKTPKTPNMPSEDEMLRLLKQDAKRRQYMQSPKAKAKRKDYQEKRKAEAQAARSIVKNDPALLERLIQSNPELAILRPKQ